MSNTKTPAPKTVVVENRSRNPLTFEVSNGTKMQSYEWGIADDRNKDVDPILSPVKRMPSTQWERIKAAHPAYIQALLDNGDLTVSVPA